MFRKVYSCICEYLRGWHKYATLRELFFQDVTVKLCWQNLGLVILEKCVVFVAHWAVGKSSYWSEECRVSNSQWALTI